MKLLAKSALWGCIVSAILVVMVLISVRHPELQYKAPRFFKACVLLNAPGVMFAGSLAHAGFRPSYAAFFVGDAISYWLTIWLCVLPMRPILSRFRTPNPGVVSPGE